MKKKKLCAYLLFGSIIAVGLAAKARGERASMGQFMINSPLCPSLGVF